MLGWKLFKHAILMIVRNISDIAKIGALPFAIGAAILAMVSSLAIGASGPNSIGIGVGAVTGFVVILLCSFWFIVSWHRFVLLEERPQGWMNGPKPQIKAYIWTALKLVFVMFVAAIPMIILGFLVETMPIIALPLLIAFGLFLFIAFFRVSLILPAAAVGQTLTIAEAFNETRGNTGAFVLIILCSIGLGMLLQLGVAVLMLVPVLGALASIAAQLFTSMLNVSILTTLYGYFIEKRAL